MSRPPGRRPVSRTTVLLIAAGLGVVAIAVAVPDSRGGLYLLGLAGAACGWVVLTHRRRT